MYNQYQSAIKSRSKRFIPKDADKIMDAPNLVQDYYCNVIHWVRFIHSMTHSITHTV